MNGVNRGAGLNYASAFMVRSANVLNNARTKVLSDVGFRTVNGDRRSVAFDNTNFATYGRSGRRNGSSARSATAIYIGFL